MSFGYLLSYYGYTPSDVCNARVRYGKPLDEYMDSYIRYNFPNEISREELFAIVVSEPDPIYRGTWRENMVSGKDFREATILDRFLGNDFPDEYRKDIVKELRNSDYYLKTPERTEAERMPTSVDLPDRSKKEVDDVGDDPFEDIVDKG